MCEYFNEYVSDSNAYKKAAKNIVFRGRNLLLQDAVDMTCGFANVRIRFKRIVLVTVPGTDRL